MAEERDTPNARNRLAAALTSLEARLEETKARRFDSDNRVRCLENGIRDGPSSAVISSHWRGTLPDREGLWTGAHPEKLVSFTAFRESYLSLLCDISTSDLFDTSRVIQLVATLFSLRRRWPDWVQHLSPLVWISPVVYQVRVSGLGFTGIKDWQRRGGWVGGIGRLVEFIQHGPLFSLTGSLA
ncbi:BQ5605_C003g02561 [Microbotryum silenes-dioicae]|uniref:BQ5605_C003g02561 protein n=1 Tax=Microbotryum silenes-dioicae TaxID=796604 RepID=A0A2X0P4Z0_9BASI|nr:BQ5605_C003g02561 [Microbotryum silenes-dioicae]